jgi:hypothetical protein
LDLPEFAGFLCSSFQLLSSRDLAHGWVGQFRDRQDQHPRILPPIFFAQTSLPPCNRAFPSGIEIAVHLLRVHGITSSRRFECLFNACATRPFVKSDAPFQEDQE